MNTNRRTFLANATSAATAASFLSTAERGLRADSPTQTSPARQAGPTGRRPRIAAINSIYRLRSHAYHIAGRFIFGYSHNGFHHQPPFQLVRMFNDQYPADDLSKTVCPKHGIQLCDTVEQALSGESTLDVDGVLLIIEHGEYPMNDRGQILYPRFEMFQRIVNVFRRTGRSVPVFVDKHLSYDHVQAIEMVRTAKELGFPLMAGSSLPVTWRVPEIEPPLNSPFREGLVVFGYDRSTTAWCKLFQSSYLQYRTILCGGPAIPGRTNSVDEYHPRPRSTCTSESTRKCLKRSVGGPIPRTGQHRILSRPFC